MRLDKLDVTFINNESLKIKTLDFINQVHLEFQSPILTTLLENKENKENKISADSIIDDNEANDVNTVSNSAINSIFTNSIDYNPEEFPENEEDWAVWNSKDEYPPFMHEHNQEYHSYDDSEGTKFFFSSHAYSFPDENDSSYLYKGFLYLKASNNQEFILPCLLREDCHLKYIGDFTQEWIDYFDSITCEEKLKYRPFSEKQLYVITKNSYFKTLLDTTLTSSFNNIEDAKLLAVLKEDLEKEKNYFNLSIKLSSVESSPVMKRMKI